MTNPCPVRVIAVSSGKGGVGKTSISVNLGIAFTELGKEVLLLDADLGLANVDVLLGLQPSYNLAHVINGERALEEILVPGPSGMKIVPAASGVERMGSLSHAEHAGLIRAFSELSYRVDVLLVDTAAGISDSVISFCRASQDVIIVICDEPTSITDAYALIKLLSRNYGVFRFRILANMTQSAQEGHELFRKISKVTDQYLDVMLDYMGTVPHDEFLRKAVRRQRAVIQAYPRSRSAQAFKNLARRADNWRVPERAGGHLEFFVERLIQYTQSVGEIMP